MTSSQQRALVALLVVTAFFGFTLLTKTTGFGLYFWLNPFSWAAGLPTRLLGWFTGVGLVLLMSTELWARGQSKK